ncbi:MAG: succinyl-diaminopimelate desuccinylase [Alphaproteobacteria bacterium]|jgi:succinyl-diaminopimelate desuccinylase|nr:succinyl-diaminopimelate desuccinylase [Alphaproteobacteria bacterium]
MENAPRIDPIELSRDLIRCASVTPTDDGALDILQAALEGLGFVCHRLPFSAPGTATVDNLYARFGDGRPNLCFAGHTDVVPIGDAGAWGAEPFAGFVSEGTLYGRGAVDMKGAVACFAAAAERFLQDKGDSFDGAVSLLITGDEEGPAVNGTVRVLDWMREAGEVIDHCLVGEPTNPERLGEMIKNGRRGSLNGRITVKGCQGHVAYPHLADNPVPRLLALLSRLTGSRFEDGDDAFQATNLEITSLDAGIAATNVIPAEATALFNIRFNVRHTGASLRRWIESQCAAVGGDVAVEIEVSGEAFLTPPGDFTGLLAAVIEETTGLRPVLSTTGGTSDARFIKDHCPVAEFGLVSQTMHKINEQVPVSDLELLTRIYECLLHRYFDRGA